MSGLDYSQHNKKIAKLRGIRWKQKLREAKLKNNGAVKKALAHARFNAGLTQRDITKKIGLVSPTTYARIERGELPTFRKRAEMISGVVNKNINDLFIEFDKDKFLAI